MGVISYAAVDSFLNGHLVTGIIGFIFINMMSFTLGIEINKGSDSDVFKRVSE
jgi:hypothetical protein